MSRPHKTDWKAAVMGYFTPLLLSLGMSLTLLKALLPQQAVWPGVLLCAGFTLVFYALFSLPIKRKWIFPLLLALALGVWGALGGGPIFTLIQLGKAGFLSFRGIPDAAAPYADTARWAVCLLFSLVAAALYWDHTLALSVFTVITVTAMAFLFGAQAELLLYVVPGAAGLLLMAAEGGGKRAAALIAALFLSIAAFLLMPDRPKAVSPFQETAESIKQFVEDYLLFNEFRSTFSLSTEGFQPLEERLGGPAEPEDHSVMEVGTNRTVLLRGKTYDDYTGLNWYDSLSSRRYLFASPRFTALKDELFDMNRPLSGSGGVSPQTLRIHMLGNGPTTLFAPVRTLTMQLESERMVLYYNMAAERFITRDLKAGDAYTITYLPFAPGNRATEEIIAQCAALPDPHYQEVLAQYMNIPRHVQQEIYDLAARVTAGKNTPYEKALAIQEYLKRNYRYNLHVQNPPDGVDFMAWFLIGEKEGYCTYFATAMTMLCRIAGVPARYVTGYLAIPDDDGVALVTGEQAHAWTEVYLNGFGWLDFDATPRSDNDRNSDPDSDGGAAPNEQPTPSPSPSPEPTPSPSPEPEDQPTPTPDPSNPPPQEDQPPESTPTPPPRETPSPSPAPEQGNEKGSPKPPFPWWILLLILLLTLLIIWRYLSTEPVRRAKKKPQEGAEILFKATLSLLARKGYKRLPQETLHDFAYRCDEPLRAQGLPSLVPLTDQIAAQVYGRHAADPAPFRRAYLSLRKATPPLGRFAAALGRMAGKNKRTI